MKSGTLKAGALVALTLLALGLSIVEPVSPLTVHVGAPHRGNSDGLPWLTTSGQQVVDEHGQVVTLRGFNTDALLDYSAWTPVPIKESDAAMM